MTATMEAVHEGPDYSAGDLKVGDRVRIATSGLGHRGALGTVIRIDEPGVVFPVVVRLDVETPVDPGPLSLLGLPLSAQEVEKYVV